MQPVYSAARLNCRPHTHTDTEAAAYLVSLLAAGHGAGEGLLLPSVHAHGAEDGLRADGTLRGPRLVAV